MIYTVVLFFLLRRRANRIQQDYAALLAAARRMAGGDLATPVEGDMGLFDPLKDELNQVRAGFEKAVAAEVRSQNMKTELITNVSHDLKNAADRHHHLCGPAQGPRPFCRRPGQIH